jgi:hypothetical protein
LAGLGEAAAKRLGMQFATQLMRVSLPRHAVLLEQHRPARAVVAPVLHAKDDGRLNPTFTTGACLR